MSKVIASITLNLVSARAGSRRSSSRLLLESDCYRCRRHPGGRPGHRAKCATSSYAAHLDPMKTSRALELGGALRQSATPLAAGVVHGSGPWRQPGGGAHHARDRRDNSAGRWPAAEQRQTLAGLSGTGRPGADLHLDRSRVPYGGQSGWARDESWGVILQKIER